MARSARVARPLSFLALAALLLWPACADGPTVFRASDRLPSDARPLRLTYSPGDDRAPIFSAAGDSVYYAAENPDALPAGGGILVAVPAGGGGQRAVVPSSTPDDGLPRWFTAPALSASGDRLAYVQIPAIVDPFASADSVRCDDGGRHPAGVPQLATIRLRVNALPDATGAAPAAELGVSLAGISIEAGSQYVLRDYPFQQLFRTEGLYAFRPSWAPDGRSLAFSDGLQLRIWRPGQDTGRVLPGTADGVSPAWSPDGQWIAFSRLEHADSVARTCYYLGRGGQSFAVRQIAYALTARTLVLVHPDGSGMRELGPGGQPAWTSDGTALYARRDGALWRIGVDGGAAPLQGAGDAWEPAVSPAGDRIVFTREQSNSTKRDVWILDLP